MCIEDVRLGRSTGIASTTVTLPAAGTVTTICRQSNDRTHLMIASSNRQRFNVSPAGITPSSTAGIAVGALSTVGADLSQIGFDVIDMDIQRHGRLVTLPWSGVAVGGADAIIIVIETFLEKE